jgi:hypothetical protein
MTQLDRAVPRRELGSARWSLILGTAMAAILFGGLLIVTSPGFVEPVPEAISIRTDLSLGTFTATGDAVDSGRICAGGVFVDQRPDSPRQPPGGIMATRFVCGDGGADFRIRGEVVKRNPLFKQDEGVWRVVNFRGTDTNLEGAGRFIARKDSLGHKILTVTYIGEMTLPP